MHVIRGSRRVRTKDAMYMISSVIWVGTRSGIQMIPRRPVADPSQKQVRARQRFVANP